MPTSPALLYIAERAIDNAARGGTLVRMTIILSTLPPRRVLGPLRSVRIPQEAHEHVKLLARQTHRSIGEIIAIAVAEVKVGETQPPGDDHPHENSP